MANDKMALRPYLEAIQALCDRLSRDELAEVIIGLAKQRPVGQRQSFLSRLSEYTSDSKAPSGKTNVQAELFDRIEALKEDIQERQESIEDGSYWETMDYDGYYDDEPDTIADDQVEELMTYFREAERYFLDNRLELARDVHGRLFELLGEFDELKYAMPGRSDTFDLKEAKARYCRCVYDTSKAKDRVNVMMDAMEVHASSSESLLVLDREHMPMLQDVIDAKPGDMHNWEGFLKGWQAALKKHKSNRADVLLLEAASLTGGIEAVSSLAKKWGKAQPRGYVYWIQRLLHERDYRAASNACLEALKILPNNSFREQIAGYLVQSAESLSDKSLVLTGKRERFKSCPGESHLLELVDEANHQGVREKELAALRSASKTPKDSYGRENTLYTKYLLMTGDLKAAYEDDKKPTCVGWSYAKTGLVFGSVLYMVCDRSDRAATICSLLQGYANRSSDYITRNGHQNGTTLYDEICRGLSQGTLDKADKTRLLNWANRIGRKRIDRIVSNKHRNAYERAATVLGALSECFILTDQNNKAQQLVDTFYANRYKGYPAFRKEVKSVFNASAILRPLQL